MTTSMISTAGSLSISKPNISSPKPFLAPSSHLNFNTHFSKSSFPLKNSRYKLIKTSLIKAAMANPAYVNTESFYDLLGISESETLSEIKKAYKKLARKYHPDVSPPAFKEDYTKMFIKVQEAYETLSDPESRALYNRDMVRGRRRSCSSEGLEDRSEWEQRWQSQLADLIRKSNTRDSQNMSWGARMRSQRIVN